jgi:hypothetical protein
MTAQELANKINKIGKWRAWPHPLSSNVVLISFLNTRPCFSVRPRDMIIHDDKNIDSAHRILLKAKIQRIVNTL